MATYDAHVADSGTTLTRTLSVGGTALGDLTGATFTARVTNPSGDVESWTVNAVSQGGAGWYGLTAGRVQFVTPDSSYWDEVGTWTWDVRYTLSGVSQTCDPITLTVGPSGAPPGTAGPPEATWINVRGYGAVGDGATDDEPAIQYALDVAAGQTNGAVVYFPPGVYYLGNGLLVGGNTHVIGAGRGLTILRGAATYAGKTVNGHGVTATLCACAVDHVTIEAITIDHTTNGTFANGITLEPDGADFTLGTPATYCVIKDCEVLGAAHHEYLIWNLRGQHNRIVDNIVDGSVAGGDQMSGVELFGSYDVEVRGNTIRRVASPVLVFAALGYDNCANEHVRVLDNFIEDCASGIVVAGCWDAVSGAQNVKDIVVRGNQIYNLGASGNGIAVSALMSQVTLDSVLVEGNVIDGCVKGISLDGVSKASLHRGLVVRGNILRDCSAPTGGALQALNVIEALIEGNYIESSGNDAIYLSSADNVIVRGNVVQGYHDGIAGATCENLIVEGNVFRAGTNWPISMTALTDAVIRNNVNGVANVTGNRVRCEHNDRVGITEGISFVNSATNPNVGEVTFTLGATFMDVTNSLVSDTSRIVCVQKAGTLRMWSVVATVTGFRITISAAAAGDEVFRWEIVQ